MDCTFFLPFKCIKELLFSNLSKSIHGYHLSEYGGEIGKNAEILFDPKQALDVRIIFMVAVTPHASLKQGFVWICFRVPMTLSVITYLKILLFEVSWNQES